jgi:hypothetical protein
LSNVVDDNVVNDASGSDPSIISKQTSGDNEKLWIGMEEKGGVSWLDQAQATSKSLADGYAALARVIRPAIIQPVLLAAHAAVILSGDRHRLDGKTPDEIRGVTANQ